MFLPRRLFIYIASNYFYNFFVIIAALSASLYFVNIFDILNRLKNVIIPVSTLFALGSMKIPYLIFEIYPFCIFLSLLLYLDKISRNNELCMVFSSGVSIWKFMQPVLASCIIISIIMTSLIQPFSVYLKKEQINIENKLLGSEDKISFLAGSYGIFIYEGNISGEGSLIYTAKYLSAEQGIFDNMTIFILDNSNKIVRKIDADHALLKDSKLEFLEPAIVRDINGVEIERITSLKTNLLLEELMARFEYPENISFWELGSVAENLSKTGLNSDKFVTQYYKILFKPIYAIAIAILAICFASVSQRGYFGYRALFIGSLCGIIIYAFKEISSTFLLYNQFSNASSQLLPIIIIMAISYYYIAAKFDEGL